MNRYITEAESTLREKRTQTAWNLSGLPLKRGYYGVYHKMSVKHLQRYINEFSQRVTVRPMHTIDQINLIISGLVGKRLTYRDLIA